MTGPFQPPTPWPSSQGPGGSVPSGPPGPSDSISPHDATFGGRFPAPPAPSNEQVTKGGGGGRWVAAIVAVLAVLGLLFLVWRADRSADDAVDVAEAEDRSGGDSEAESDSNRFERGEGEDPLAQPDFDDPLGGGGGGVPFRPDSIAADESSVWVSDEACGLVAQIDKQTLELVNVIDIGGSASGVTIADGSVWVGTRQRGLIVRLDPVTLTVEDLVSVPGFALGLAAAGDEVWVTDPEGAVVYRVEAPSGELLDAVPVGDQAHHIAVGDGTAWVTNYGANTVTRVDVADGVATSTLDVGTFPLHVELGEGSAWVTDGGDGTVHRLDEDTGEVEAVIDVGMVPHALAVAAGSVWVGTETNTFWRIDPATNEAVRVEGAEFTSIDTTVDGTDIWVADWGGSSVVRFDAAAGVVDSIVAIDEFGDCEALRAEAVTPPLVEAI